MQIQRRAASASPAPPHGPGTAGADRPGAPQRAARAGAHPAPAAALDGRPAAAARRRGVAKLDHPLQGEIAGAQRALAFLDRSAAQLQALKNELAARLSARQGRGPANQADESDARLATRLRQFSAAWQARAQASGNTLNAQLNYSGVEPASQRFRIDGLDLATLAASAPAVVAFSAAGENGQVQSVSIEPGMTGQDIARRFDHALAPVGVRAAAGPAGELLFGTSEANWPALRASLRVRASGIALPDVVPGSGRPVTREEPPAIAPGTWSGADGAALRNTLQQVVQALAQVQQARQAVQRSLDAAGIRVASVQPDAAMDVAGVLRMTDNFVAAAVEPGYASLLSVSSALVGIDREQVVALLGLR